MIVPEGPMTAAGPIILRLGETDGTIVIPDQDVRGDRVSDANGHELGKVRDLLLDAAVQKVRFLVVAYGGVLGMGSVEAFLPVDLVTGIDDQRLFVDTVRDRVYSAPGHDPHTGYHLPFLEMLYGYYGITPFWWPGYRAPRFVLSDGPDGLDQLLL